MKGYGKYKDSGIEWLGGVPKDWSIKKIKHITSFISKGTTPSTVGKEIKAVGNIRFIKAENINDNLVCNKPKNYIDEETNKILQRSELKEKDILFVIAGATIGKVAIVPKNFLPANTNQAVSFIRLLPDENEKFCWYWLQSFRIQEILWINTVQSAQPNLSMENLGNFYITYPEKKEQQKIAAYLDHKTTLIDTLIEKKKRLIDLLKEERTAVINQAVTKGLDPNVQFKDSGIEWLGEIPAHWEVKKFKYFFTLITEKIIGTSDKKIALENIESWTGKLIETDTQFEGEGIAFKNEDILFGKLRPYLAKVLYPKFRGSAVGDIYVFRPQVSIDSEFSFYRILTRSFINLVNGATYGAKMPRASWDFIGNLLIAFPSLNEQVKIAKSIRTETTRIDTLITKTQNQIELLQEYRTALISEVVTGKIDVRDWNEPE